MDQPREEILAELRKIDTPTITNAVARMETLGHDPLRPILDEAPDLLGALERLLARV